MKGKYRENKEKCFKNTRGIVKKQKKRKIIQLRTLEDLDWLNNKERKRYREREMERERQRERESMRERV